MLLARPEQPSPGILGKKELRTSAVAVEIGSVCASAAVDCRTEWSTAARSQVGSSVEGCEQRMDKQHRQDSGSMGMERLRK